MNRISDPVLSNGISASTTHAEMITKENIRVHMAIWVDVQNFLCQLLNS